MDIIYCHRLINYNILIYLLIIIFYNFQICITPQYILINLYYHGLLYLVGTLSLIT